jgi:tetratricopeptide (TPR) repeat protein
LAYATRALAIADPEDHVEIGLIHDTVAKAHALRGDTRATIEAERQSVSAFLRSDRSNYRDACAAYTEILHYQLDTGDVAGGRETVAEATESLSDWFEGDVEGHIRAIEALGIRFADRGFLGHAGTVLRDALRLARTTADDRGILSCVTELAYVLARDRQSEEASALADEGLALYRKIWEQEPIDWRPGLGQDPGSDGERTRAARAAKRDLAFAFMSVGRFDEAEKLAEESRAVSGDRPGSLSTRLLSLQGQVGEAEPGWRRQVARAWMENWAEDSPVIMAKHEAGYARCLMELGRWEEAEEPLIRAIGRLKEWCGKGSTVLARTEDRLVAWERRELDEWSPDGF